LTEVSQLLHALNRGNPHAASALLPLLYDELRQLAAARLAAAPSDNTHQPTALVHEAYLRLVGTPVGDQWDHCGHFFAACAEDMCRILVENVRRRKRCKRGGDRQRVSLEGTAPLLPAPSEDLVALDEALTRLTAQDPIKAEVVKLSFFAGRPGWKLPRRGTSRWQRSSGTGPTPAPGSTPSWSTRTRKNTDKTCPV
jgi:RNA polymerase sigma factor (TIGR02999 family)